MLLENLGRDLTHDGQELRKDFVRPGIKERGDVTLRHDDDMSPSEERPGVVVCDDRLVLVDDVDCFEAAQDTVAVEVLAHLKSLNHTDQQHRMPTPSRRGGEEVGA